MGQDPRFFRGRRGCFELASADGLAVCEQHCDEVRTGWLGPGVRSRHALVLPCSGGFRLRADGVEHFVDPTVGHFEWPGQELSLAHPLGRCGPATLIDLPAEVAEGELAGRLAAGAVPRDGRLELWHRSLVASCRRGIDGFEVAERLWVLLDLVPTADDHRTVRAARYRAGTEAAHRGLVASARELLAAGEFTLGLAAVAALLGCSPSHLSRVFRRVTGTGLTAYRNRLRVRAVLGDLAGGASNLRSLAAAYGFADQAHLTRVVRADLGVPPSAARALVRGN